MIKVSVILTTYNSAKSLNRVLDSILYQDGVGNLFDLELIVVDDCSTDETQDILEQQKVHFYSTKKNTGGPNRGRNIGLDNAQGDYICVADHDDIWKPHKLKTLLPILEQAQIVTSGYTVHDIKTKKNLIRVADKRRAKNHIFFPSNCTFLSKLCRSHSGQNTYLGSIIFSSELKHIHFEEKFGMIDFDWVLKMFYQKESIEVCESLYDRFVFGNNLSLNENYRLNDFNYSLTFVDYYKKEFPKQVKICKLRLHGSMARYYYLMNNMTKARLYFTKSERNFKTILYYLTTYWGFSYVKKHFNVFG